MRVRVSENKCMWVQACTCVIQKYTHTCTYNYATVPSSEYGCAYVHVQCTLCTVHGYVSACMYMYMYVCGIAGEYTCTFIHGN